MSMMSQSTALPQRENNEMEGKKRGTKVGFCSPGRGQGHCLPGFPPSAFLGRQGHSPGSPEGLILIQELYPKPWGQR